MSFKMCDSCCREISSYATCCPHCGHDAEGSSDGGGIWGGFFMGILQVISWILQVIIIAVGCVILYYLVLPFCWKMINSIWSFFGDFFLGILKAIGYTIALAIGCIILYLDTFLLENDYWHLEFIF